MSVYNQLHVVKWTAPFGVVFCVYATPFAIYMELRHNRVSGSKFGFGFCCVLYITAYLYLIKRIKYFCKFKYLFCNCCCVMTRNTLYYNNVSVCAHSCVRQHCKLIWRQLKFRRDIRFSGYAGIFWDLAPCCMVGSDRRFRDAYCLHHEGNVLLENHQQLVSDVRWSSGLCTQKAEGCVLMARYSWSVFLDLFNGALSTALFTLLQLQAHSWTGEPETCNT
jgi:hypothetical protein